MRTLKFLISNVLMLLFVSGFVFAGEYKVISYVEINDIDEPYEASRVFDTAGTVSKNSYVYITDINWKDSSTSNSGYYEVSVTLKPYYGYKFEGSISGTINGKSITSYYIESEDKATITYVFSNFERKTDRTAYITSTRHIINVSCNKDEGIVTPYYSRPLDGSNATFNIIPNEGYRVKDIKVDGESVGKVEEYTFYKVVEDHSIKAYFEKDIIEEEMEMKPILAFLMSLLGK